MTPLSKRKVLKTISWSLGISLVLTAILVVHIILVTKPNDTTHVNWQLSRIDFENPLDSAEAREISKAIHSIQGIKNIHINQKQGTLVYAYEVGSKSSEEIFNQFITQVNLSAEPFIAPSMEEASGCPAMDKSSLTYRFSTFVQNTLR